MDSPKDRHDKSFSTLRPASNVVAMAGSSAKTLKGIVAGECFSFIFACYFAYCWYSTFYKIFYLMNGLLKN